MPEPQYTIERISTGDDVVDRLVSKRDALVGDLVNINVIIQAPGVDPLAVCLEVIHHINAQTWAIRSVQELRHEADERVKAEESSAGEDESTEETGEEKAW
jgi:hypothetical protein